MCFSLLKVVPSSISSLVKRALDLRKTLPRIALIFSCFFFFKVLCVCFFFYSFKFFSTLSMCLFLSLAIFFLSSPCLYFFFLHFLYIYILITFQYFLIIFFLHSFSLSPSSLAQNTSKLLYCISSFITLTSFH